MGPRISLVVAFVALCSPAAAQPEDGLGAGPRVSNRGARIALGAHPDAAFQATLRAEAQRLSKAKTPGVSLWTQIAKKAVDRYAARRDLTIQQRFDRVLRDTTAVLVGAPTMRKHIKTLREYDANRFLSLPGARNPLVTWLLKELDRMPDVYAGDDLDKTRCSDFRPAFRDGSMNQIFHTYFYVVMAYFTGDHYAVTLGNLHHEVFDPHGSWADYDVGNWAAHLGVNVRKLRDAGKLQALYAFPTLIGATFGTHAVTYGHPDANDGRDFRPMATQVDETVKDRLHNPSGTVSGWLTENTRRGVISVFNAFKRDGRGSNAAR